MRFQILFLSLFLFCCRSWSELESKKVYGSTLAETKKTLELPLEKRKELLIVQGPQSYKNLVHLAFSEEALQETRWRALMSIVQLGGVKSLPEIERALNHSTWFMRSAGLLALYRISTEKAHAWARKLLLSDPALLVRNTALRVIEKMAKSESLPVLWQSMDQNHNFYRGKSLWIRKNIFKQIINLSDSSQTEKIIAVLEDQDESLHRLAIEGLETITGKKQKFKDTSLEVQRAYWRSWWKRQIDEAPST